MKKFPEIDEYYIKQLSNSDPSGKNAYLMWMAQALKDAGAGIYTVPGLASEKVIEIVPVVTAFDKAKQRISQLNKQRKKDGKTLYPNDINQFGSLEDLEDFFLGIAQMFAIEFEDLHRTDLEEKLDSLFGGLPKKAFVMAPLLLHIALDLFIMRSTSNQSPDA